MRSPRTLRVSTLLSAAGDSRSEARLPFASLPPEEKATMSDVYFGTDLFSELDRLQRQMSSLFGWPPLKPSFEPDRHLSSYQHRYDRRLGRNRRVRAGRRPVEAGYLSRQGAADHCWRTNDHPGATAGRYPAVRTGTVQRLVPAGRRIAAAGGPGQGASPLCRWLPADFGRQTRGVQATRYYRSVTR